ncbi:hypothetical protein H2248_007254 [Termitomyces sp. 'cryptogamus']|nr:hypothetical protein H2248_007254 [Termitomyces sp. 'cryptogamus']
MAESTYTPGKFTLATFDLIPLSHILSTPLRISQKNRATLYRRYANTWPISFALSSYSQDTLQANIFCGLNNPAPQTLTLSSGRALHLPPRYSGLDPVVTSTQHSPAFRFQQRGVNAIALQPLWCALRPGKCDLNA